MKRFTKLFLVMALLVSAGFADDGHTGTGGYTCDGHTGTGGYVCPGHTGTGGVTEGSDPTGLATKEEEDEKSLLEYMTSVLEQLF